MIAPTGVHHLALRVSDLDRAAGFYAGVLGLRRHSTHRDGQGRPRAIWLELGAGAVLMLELSLRGIGPETGSGHVLVLAVDGLAAWAERLAAAGVEIADRSAYTLFFADPDGHRLGLSVYPMPPAE